MNKSVENFHANCLETWNSNNCPVCYYIKNPDLLKNSSCMKCTTKDSLWFCIICGHIGCKGEQRHALDHYNETQHNYVMDLKKFKVWDYKLKQFLHISNANDQDVEIVCNQMNDENRCSCSVCQYNFSPKLLQQATCMTCEDTELFNLWMCFSCSHVGCNTHAYLHFMRTNHPYSMELNHFSIWDYTGHTFLRCQLHDKKKDLERKLEELSELVVKLNGEIEKLSATKAIKTHETEAVAGGTESKSIWERRRVYNFFILCVKVICKNFINLLRIMH